MTSEVPEKFWLRQPWAHQREVFARAVEMRDYALFLEMGTGKTFTTINLLRWRYLQAGRVMRTLVFAPKIVLTNWKREFETASKVGPKVHILRGPGNGRVKDFKLHGWASGPQGLEFAGGIFVTNFESLQMKPLYKAMQDWRPEIIVIDEAHKLKKFNAKRTLLAIKLADQAKHRYILTGSPILNTHLDIWAQYRLLDRGETFDPNYYAFRARYFVDKNAGMPKEKYFPKWVPTPGIEPVLNQLIYAKASRVLKKNCLDLPPLIKDCVEVEMAPEQARVYKEMAKSFIATLNDKNAVARIVLTQGLRLQQIVSGHFKADDGSVTRFLKNPRLEVLSEYLEDLTPTDKVIVWAVFKEDAAQIRELLDKLEMAHTVLVGGMTAAQQQLSIDTFQNDAKCRVMIANQQAAGVGINLTAASYSIYYSRNFSLEADLQSESRNYRGGSEIHEKITRIDLVCPKTIDEEILKALYAKEDLAERILSLRDRLN